jgi:hypothetical protein
METRLFWKRRNLSLEENTKRSVVMRCSVHKSWSFLVVRKVERVILEKAVNALLLITFGKIHAEIMHLWMHKEI